MTELQRFNEPSDESKNFISRLDDDQLDGWLEILDKDLDLCRDLGRRCSYLVTFKELHNAAKELKSACVSMREAMDGLMDYLENESSRRWNAKSAK